MKNQKEMKMTKVITILLALSVLTAMAGIAAADPGGTASPTEVTININTDASVDITFKFWDLTANTIDQARFYMWQDNNNNGAGDDLNGNLIEGDLPGDLSDAIEMSIDGGSTWSTKSLIMTVPPGAWDSVEVGQPTLTETRYTKTIKVRDANNGATINDRYFVSGTAGLSTAATHVLITNTDIIPVPEFATIALPVAGILGLFVFFSHRKRK